MVAGVPDGTKLEPGRPLVFDETQVREAVTMEMAIGSSRRAFALTRVDGLAAPMPWHLKTSDGEVHVKGAAVAREPVFAIKTATGFPGNAKLKLPTSTGFSAVFDSATGRLLAMLLDNGYLTELRTGAAGGLAADLLAPAEVATAAIIGTSGQARYQLEGLFAVRQPRSLRLCGRRAEGVAELARWVRDRWDVDVRPASDPDDAVRGADAVVTVTNSTAPLFGTESLAPHAHVTAVGSDSPGKRELPADLLTSAALVAVDSLEQSQRLGELQGIDPAGIPVLVTIGELVTEPRERPRGRTVADLSGLGIQDTTVAAAALDVLADAASSRPA